MPTEIMPRFGLTMPSAVVPLAHVKLLEGRRRSTRNERIVARPADHSIRDRRSRLRRNSRDSWMQSESGREDPEAHKGGETERKWQKRTTVSEFSQNSRN